MASNRDNLYTKTQFARYCGVSHVSIIKAVQAHKLIVVGTHIDLHNINSQAYIDNLETKRHVPRLTKAEQKLNRVRRHNPQRVAKPKKLPVPKKRPASKKHNKSVSIDEPIAPSRSYEVFERPSDYDELVVSRDTIAYVRQYESIRNIRVKTAKEQGKLIDRDKIATLFANLYTIDANSWKTLPANASSELAAAFGIDDKSKILAAEEILNRKVHQILKHSRRLMIDFVKDIEAKGDNLDFEGV